MKSRWLPGNQVRLLENGEAFYPAVFEAIASARYEVLVETFIVFEDKVGWDLHAALLQAARNGARAHLLVDGFGSPDLGPAFVAPLLAAGVQVRSFDASVRLLGVRLNVLRRMHRKIVVVDGRRAFVGGINYSADHLADFGPLAKQDFAVEAMGPVAGVIRRFVHTALRGGGMPRRRFEAEAPAGPATAVAAGSVQAMFVTRDNLEHRNDIERHYRAAIRAARRQVLIANAYFFPGYRLLRELHRAARRGVEVHLILQGAPDVPLARSAAQLLYDYLRRGGVHIHEYCERPMHGKVAVVDDEWATVGSSNLDPVSLSLNLEANLMLRDRTFAAELRGRLEALMRDSCREVATPPPPRWPLWSQLRGLLVFHFLRHFSVWASWLPRHAPRLSLPLRPAGAALPAPVLHHDTEERCPAR